MAAILLYESRHFDAVGSLWRATFPEDLPWNRADVSIPEKMRIQPGLFFVEEEDGGVIGTVMAGYDGHRGWLYAVAVKPGNRRTGIGSALLAEAERDCWLSAAERSTCKSGRKMERSPHSTAVTAIMWKIVSAWGSVCGRLGLVTQSSLVLEAET